MKIQNTILAATIALTTSFLQAADAPATPPIAPPPPKPKPTPAPRTAESAVTPKMANEGRHKNFLEAGKKPGIQLLFLGDSISDAFPGRGKAVWTEHYAPFNAVSFGVSGERTENTLGHIAGGVLDGMSPKVVVIMIGTNNVGHFADEKPEWAAAGVKKIVGEVRTKLPASKILLLGVFPRDKKGSPRRVAVEGINAIIKGYDDGKSVRYLDISSKFLSPEGDIPKDIMPDGLHPNEAGYKVWAEAMKPLLDEMMK